MVHGELLDAAGEPVGIVWMDPARRELRGAKKAQTERRFLIRRRSLPRSRSC